MQSDNPILDDLAKIAGGAAGTAHGLKREIEAAVRARVERIISEFDLVPREELEVVRDMARKARTENDELKKRIAKLEKKIAGRSPRRKAASGKKKARGK